MKDQAPKSTVQPTLASVETNFIGTLFGFFTKTMTLVRESSLDDDQKKVVAGRINSLIDNAKDEIQRTKQLDPSKPLQAIYDEIKRLVDELSGAADGGGKER